MCNYVNLIFSCCVPFNVARDGRPDGRVDGRPDDRTDKRVRSWKRGSQGYNFRSRCSIVQGDDNFPTCTTKTRIMVNTTLKAQYFGILRHAGGNHANPSDVHCAMPWEACGVCKVMFVVWHVQGVVVISQLVFLHQRWHVLGVRDLGCRISGARVRR